MFRVKEFFAGNSTSGGGGQKSTTKKVFLALFASILLAAAIVGVVVGVKSRKEHSDDSSDNIKLSRAHAIAKSSCSNTLYPELCYSAIADSLDGGGGKEKVKSKKDIIILSLNVTIAAVRRNYFAIEKLLAGGGGGAKSGNLTEREKSALHDCLETIGETLDELHAAVEDLKEYPSLKKTVKNHADDLKTLISSAITNQETCLDGFSHGKTDRHAREILVGGQVVRVEKLCSNSLAMICNMTDTDIESERCWVPVELNNYYRPNN